MWASSLIWTVALLALGLSLFSKVEKDLRRYGVRGRSMRENSLMIRVENVKKQYRLGQIGGGTLRGDLQSWWAASAARRTRTP